MKNKQIERSAESILIFNAGPLFGLASGAYRRIPKEIDDRELGQMDALIAVVFAAVALDAFINEIAHYALMPVPSGFPPNPESITSMGQLAKEAEGLLG